MPARRLDYTVHARDMLSERQIPEEWVDRAVAQPDRVEEPGDGTTHCLRAVPEHGGRVLRVVLSTRPAGRVVVTVFFDRRLRRQQ